MVDSINPYAGQVKDISSVKSTSQKQSEDTKKPDSAERSAPVDDIQISQEALSLAQAEKAAREIASSLSADNVQTLSGDEDRLNALA